jgi:AGCS family alanine or glycine:cation symporter
MKLDMAWTLADIFNGLMALPNLVALLLLTPVITKTTRDYLKNVKKVDDITDYEAAAD